MKSAIVSAIIAAIVSTGAATAATGWINGSSIRPGTIRISRLAPGAITKLQGATGPQGIAGPQGPQGPQGEQGPAGYSPTLNVDANGCLEIGGSPSGIRDGIGFLGHRPVLYCPQTSTLCVAPGGPVTFGGADGSSCNPADDKVKVVTGWAKS